jgi:hypothetical protein
MATEKKIICPLMQRPCIEDGAIIDGELCACKFWVHIVGKHPQTGADQDLWDCSHSWLPVLLIDNTQRQRETGAAVESFRNEMVQANKTNTHLLLAAAHIEDLKLLT